MTLPGLFGGAVLLVALAPLGFAATLALDAARRGRLAGSRALAAALAWAGCECLGILAAFGLWVGGGTWAGNDPSRFLRWNFRLQTLWARALLGALARIYGIRIRIARNDPPGEGPILVFARHVSLMDPLLPAVFLSGRAGLQLRYVMKRALLFDPCLDVVGQRLPNVFVRRGEGSAEAEATAIGRLAADIGRGEGVIAFPEGTRFTPRRHERALARVAESDPQRFERVEHLRHLLPPRSRGSLAILDAGSGHDVLFLAHSGLEHVGSLGDILGGSLIDQAVEVETWRVAGSDIPEIASARLAWLDTEWLRMDDWLAERAAGDGRPEHAAGGST